MYLYENLNPPDRIFFFVPNFIGSQSLPERTAVKTIFKILVWRNFEGQKRKKLS